MNGRPTPTLQHSSKGKAMNTKPGTTTIRIGLALAALWLVLMILGPAMGQTSLNAGPLLIGLVVAAVGYARRVLAAVERGRS